MAKCRHLGHSNSGSQETWSQDAIGRISWRRASVPEPSASSGCQFAHDRLVWKIPSTSERRQQIVKVFKWRNYAKLWKDVGSRSVSAASHDKSLRLGLTAGLRVFVCSNMAFSGEFTPVLAKHSM